MNKLTTLILLVTIILTLSIAACGDKDGNNSLGNNTSVESTPTPDGFIGNPSETSATATYGAEQFYIQLTAIANENQ